MEIPIKRQKRAKQMLSEIKQLIIVAATSSDTNRNELAFQLIEEIKKRFPKETPPVEETVVKLISKARNHEIMPLDKAFNLGELKTLQEISGLNIDAAAIDHILKVQKWVMDNYFKFWELEKVKKSKKKPEGVFLFAYKFNNISIRQAKWIAMLNSVIPNNIKYLWYASFVYAYYELICEISEDACDTTQLDSSLNTIKDFWFVSHHYFYSDYSEQALQRLAKIRKEIFPQ